MDGRVLFREAFTDCSVEHGHTHAGVARDIITVFDGQGGLHSIPWHVKFDVSWFSRVWVKQTVKVYVDGEPAPELNMRFEPVHTEELAAEDVAAQVIARANNGRSMCVDYRGGPEIETAVFEAASAVAAAKTNPSKKRGTCVFTHNSSKTPDALRVYAAIQRANQQRPGADSYEITFESDYGRVAARLFVWNVYDKVVTTDIDGTLTKSGEPVGNIASLLLSDFVRLC
jgi:phosphatidate phosphatase PAH1